MRVLYGYRVERGRVSIVESEAVIVRAVLGAPYGARTAALYHVLPAPESECAIRNRINRIVAHRDAYRRGKPAAWLPADRALAIVPDAVAAV